MLNRFPFLIILSLFVYSCGSDDDSSSIPEEEVALARNFSTRLDNDLLVEGNECKGGETTEFDTRTYTCQVGQWLMVLDNQNICTDDGACTEIYVSPVIALLKSIDNPDDDYIYNVIQPVSPVSEKQLEVIRDVYVRYDFNGNTEAVKRLR